MTRDAFAQLRYMTHNIPPTMENLLFKKLNVLETEQKTYGGYVMQNGTDNPVCIRVSEPITKFMGLYNFVIN